MNKTCPIIRKNVTNYLSTVLLVLTLIFCSSCARTYFPLEPQKLNYTNTQQKEGVTFSYQHSVLENKYRNKERRREIKLIAVKCTNNTDRDLVFGTDIQLVREKGRGTDMADDYYIYRQLRQRPASHLWWMLFAFLTVNVTQGSAYNQTTSTYPVGLALAPILTITNASIAASSNRRFRQDLEEHNLLGRTIRKGETIYGLVGIKMHQYEGLSLKGLPAH